MTRIIYRRALFSGYRMATRDFIDFTNTITPIPNKDADIVDAMGNYDDWRMFLSDSEYERAPEVRYFVADALYKLDDDEIHLADAFFTVRWTPSKTKEGMKTVTDEHASTENEQDKAHLNEFVKLVESLGGHLDTSKLKFVCIKRLHPSDDPDYMSRNPRLEVFPKGISQERAEERRRALPALIAADLAEMAAFQERLAIHTAEHQAAAEKMAAKAAKKADKKAAKKAAKAGSST